VIKEGGNKEMEVDVTKQQDDDSIWTYRDQVMEDKLRTFAYSRNFYF